MSDRYIPALGHRWLTAFYDPVVRWTTREATFKARLVEQADLQPGHRVLDLGCGTATLSLMLKRQQPAATIVGLDGDPEVLAIATRKLRAAGVAIELERGAVDRLPFAAASFDRVVSSLVFHHLSPATKRAALRELRRVLRPGGQLHIADWGQAHDRVMRTAFVLVQLLDGFATTADNVAGRLPALMREAGFADADESQRLRTPLGTLSLYRATRPA
jgi:ubiquinone/menaquinone biosynthesis C-methylase UbiE